MTKKKKVKHLRTLNHCWCLKIKECSFTILGKPPDRKLDKPPDRKLSPSSGQRRSPVQSESSLSRRPSPPVAAFLKLQHPPPSRSDQRQRGVNARAVPVCSSFNSVYEIFKTNTDPTYLGYHTAVRVCTFDIEKQSWSCLCIGVYPKNLRWV
jgi:hypothetical protein